MFSAVVTTAWTTVTILAKLPELANAGAAASLGAIGVWQLLKAKFEGQDKDKKPKKG